MSDHRIRSEPMWYTAQVHGDVILVNHLDKIYNREEIKAYTQFLKHLSESGESKIDCIDVIEEHYMSYFGSISDEEDYSDEYEFY